MLDNLLRKRKSENYRACTVYTINWNHFFWQFDPFTLRLKFNGLKIEYVKYHINDRCNRSAMILGEYNANYFDSTRRVDTYRLHNLIDYTLLESRNLFSHAVKIRHIHLREISIDHYVRLRACTRQSSLFWVVYIVQSLLSLSEKFMQQ